MIKLTTIFALTLVIAGLTPNMYSAFAAEGDTLAILDCADTGVTVAFDGTTLYYIHGLSGTVMGTCDTAGAVLPDIPITGLVGGDVISALSYDKDLGVLWAATPDKGGQVRNIYNIVPATGAATLLFSVTTSGGFSLTDGLAYDGEDTSFWISGDVSSTIDHFDTDGTPIATGIPIPIAPGNTCGNSGIAAGTGVLYLGFNGCNIVQKHNKADMALLDDFTVATGRTEDMECDNVTFPGVDAIWTKDAFDPELVAFEVPDGTCPVGGGGDVTVAGELLSINTTALFVSGVFGSAMWIAPVAAGIAGIGLYLTKSKLK